MACAIFDAAAKLPPSCHYAAALSAMAQRAAIYAALLRAGLFTRAKASALLLPGEIHAGFTHWSPYGARDSF